MTVTFITRVATECYNDYGHNVRHSGTYKNYYIFDLKFILRV